MSTDIGTSFSSFFFFCTLGYIPNGVYAVEAMLAAASIGAIWSSTSVDFGVNVRAALLLFVFV